jgi:hypothetical protein
MGTRPEIPEPPSDGRQGELALQRDPSEQAGAAQSKRSPRVNAREILTHPGAGQRSAILYSLLVSCQRHGKDPLAYLTDVLRRLPALTNQSDLTPLTPAAWQPA